ncbi:MAG: TIGR03936 family radical SAM-associated protein [Dehalogenimonas sp.]
MKRLRFQFSRGEKLKFLSHLDMMRLWPRLFRRAGIDLAYSEGFNAHPRLAVAAPLAVGWTGHAELMEVWLDSPLPADSILACLARKLPEDLTLGQGMFVNDEEPSLQSQVRFAEYRVSLPLDRPSPAIEESIINLLGLSTLDWSHRRDDETKHYDLRSQIEDISIENAGEKTISIVMLLKNDPSGSGRPEQVSLALGFKEHPLKIHRTRLVLA